MTDLSYWRNYYAAHSRPTEPSLFAVYCMQRYLKPFMDILELGCGNGRDSVYFASQRLRVTAVDQCQEELDYLTTTYPDVRFQKADFTNLKNMPPFDAVYSRFTLHTISQEEETRVFDWAYQHLQQNGYFLIEARGQKNELYRKGTPVADQPDAFVYENHFRRFLNVPATVKKLEHHGFHILSAEEKPGFAPRQNENQIFCRLIAQKTRE